MKIKARSRSELIFRAVTEHNVPYEKAPGKADRAIERKRQEQQNSQAKAIKPLASKYFPEM